MHETTARLLAAIYAAEGLSGEPAATQAAADALGVSLQRLTNWLERGVSRDGILLANRLLHINQAWVEAGTGEMVTKPVTNDLHGSYLVTPPVSGVAHLSILDKRTVAPSLGDLQMPVQETKFWARLQDDALAPTMGADTEVLCDPAAQPKPGRFIIVADPAGRLLCRKYVELLPGQWQAEALNPDYKTLDAAAHQLRVVAVVIEARPRLLWKD